MGVTIMARRNVFSVFAIGLLTGVVAMIALSGGHAIPRAIAQEDPSQQPALQLYRYQVSPWASSENHGAYIIDTTTGELWSTQDGYPIQKVGPAWKR
jgi:hypothetical protein